MHSLLHHCLSCNLCLSHPCFHMSWFPVWRSSSWHVLGQYFSETLSQLPSFPFLSNHSIPSSISSHISVFQHHFPALSSWHSSEVFRNNYRVCVSDWNVSVGMASKSLSITSWLVPTETFLVHRKIKATKLKICLAQDPVSCSGLWWTCREQQETGREWYTHAPPHTHSHILSASSL